MNVLQVVPELNAGGVEGTTLEMAEALIAQGHSAHVISAGGRMEDDLLRMGGVLHKADIGSKNIFSIFRRIRLIRAIIHEHKIDIVHARSRAPAWPAYHAARIEGAPFLTTYHGIYNSRSALKTYYNSVMARGEHIIANSEFTKAYIIKTHGTEESRITAIPRGVDMDRFNPAIISAKDILAQRNRWGITPDQKVILLPGRLTRWKGPLVAIEALANLPEDCVLVLLGDAQGRDAFVQEIKALAAELGVTSRVILPGHSRDMPTALSAAHVVISASTDPEAFGRVAAEAQAMRKPVVATAHGGALETVIDGDTGFLVPPSDPKGLSDAITRALNWPDYNGLAARSRIAAQFSKENLQAKTLTIYKELLK
ncbi:glycosyltransferase family 4 protein [Hellea balneolensis]|uniref:glycosyltransferase family 4 protein n=1 Tax=Hellea balneolensis TaxID=287478 RepID=UPI00040A4313|nr:glycosyltransferase family 4 protein [Hellea balneolensis]